MAITAEQRNDVITLLVGMFDAAPSAELLTGFVNDIAGGKTNAQLAEDLAATNEFKSLYPVWLTNDEFATNFVKNLLADNVSAATMQEGVDFVKVALAGGATRGEAVNTAVSALAAVPTSDAKWGQAAQQLVNKTDVATYFATTQDITAATFAQLRAVTAGVTEDSESVSNQKMLIDANLDTAEQYLTANQDRLTGSEGNDAFVAWIFDNQNTAQSGDMINGGGGKDTLFAEIGNSQEFAVSLKTTSVEVASFRAQAVEAKDDSDNDIGGEVQIDAQDMNGTNEFWSTDSRADLVVEDVRNNSHETTLGWRNADAGDVDYSVYYSPNYITAPDGTTSGSQLFLELLDLEAAADTGDKLTNNPYVGVKLSIEGAEYTIVGTSPITTNYADLVAALNSALTAQGLTTITASLGEEFKKFNADDGLQYAGTQIVLTNTGSETLEGIGWIADDVVPADSNVHTAINDAAPSTTTSLTQTDVIFDNIGRGSQSGDFLAGNMSLGNNSGSKGIQQFNIEVQRDSWVKSVASTNNSLEVVNVVNADGYTGDVRIGSHAANLDGLEDVRVFNASSMTGKVNLEAGLDADVIAKYDDLKDSQSDAASDNVQFSYATGSNDDTVQLRIAEEAISYEDLQLTIETNAGDDVVNFEVQNDTANLNTNWAADQAALNNITIATGAGNDTVNAFGDGEVTITTGTGNDTVYSDNSGIDNSQAAWVYNGGVAPNLTDILGEGAGGNFFLYNAKLTVTFSAGSTGAGVTAADAVANDNGFESTVDINLTDYVGNSTNLNQALKAAINNDATLSKLLKAEDGPNNSVVVTSLVDGVFNTNDLDVSISQGTLPATNNANFAAVDNAWKSFKSDSSATVTNALLATELTTAQAGTGYNGSSQLVGATPAVAAVAEVFTATFAGTEAGGDTTIVFDGVTVTLANGVTGNAVATQFATDYNASVAPAGNWAAVDNADGTVTFTQNTAGANVDVGSGDFVITANTPDAVTVTARPAVPTVQGANAVPGTTAGTASDELANDNVINVGKGDDVVVLSTNAGSNETIVFTGTDLGNVDILNFSVTGGDADVLNFNAYLNTKTSASNSTDSQVKIATSLNADADVEANSVTVIDFTLGADVDETFAALTAADLLKALNNANTGTDNYGNIGDATLDAANPVTNLVDDTRDHVVLVHNTGNDGQYKAFYLTSSDNAQAGTTDGDFASAELIGTVDLGEDAAFVAASFGA